MVPAHAATDPQVVQEIATKVDPADHAMVSLLARWQRAEKTLLDLEAKNAPASAVTRIAAQAASLRGELEDALKKKAASGQPAAGGKRTPPVPGAASTGASPVGAEDAASDQAVRALGERMGALASRMESGDRGMAGKLAQLEAKVKDVETFHRRKMRGSLQLAMKEANALADSLEENIIRKDAERERLAAAERTMPETNLDAPSLKLLGSRVLIDGPVRAPSAAENFAACIGSVGAVRENFWGFRYYRIAVAYADLGRPDTVPTTSYEAVLPVLQLPSGERLSPENLTPASSVLLSSLPLRRPIGQGLATVSGPVAPNRFLLCLFKVDATTPIADCSLVVRDPNSSQQGLIRLRRSEGDESRDFKECEKALTAVWDEIAQYTLQSSLLTQSPDMRENLAKLVTLGNFFLEQYADWKLRANEVRNAGTKKLVKVHQSLGLEASKNGDDASTRTYRAALISVHEQLDDLRNKEILFRKKAMWILDAKAGLFGRLANLTDTLTSAKSGKDDAYRNGVRALLGAQRDVIAALNSDRQHVSWSELGDSGRKTLESLREDLVYQPRGTDQGQREIVEKLLAISRTPPSVPVARTLVTSPDFIGYRFRPDNGEVRRYSEVYSAKPLSDGRAESVTRFLEVAKCRLPPALCSFVDWEPWVAQWTFRRKYCKGTGRLFINEDGDVARVEVSLGDVSDPTTRSEMTRILSASLQCYTFVPALGPDGIVASVVPFEFIANDDHPTGKVRFGLAASSGRAN